MADRPGIQLPDHLNTRVKISEKCPQIGLPYLSFWIDSKRIVWDSFVVLNDNNSNWLTRFLRIKEHECFDSVSLFDYFIAHLR